MEHLKKYTILYVEDNKEISEEIAFFLQPRVKNLYLAYNGQEGEEAFHKYKPDLIITDIQMPLRDGFEMIKTIREENSNIPIIVTSAFNEPSYLLQAIELQIDAYLLKPLNIKDLVTKMIKVIEPYELKNALILKNKELIHEKEIAQNNLKIKSEFLANMSHEIRTPLNSILGFIDIIKENESDMQNIEYLSIVQKSSKNLLGIINDILDFSKIDSGKLEIDLIEVDPYLEFNHLSKLFEEKANEKNIQLITNIDSKFPKCIKLDMLRLSQVVSNLLSNAIKFTRNNGSVTFIAEYIQETNSLHIAIKDNGIGILEKNQLNIFNAFTQADSSTTRKYGGTGLGLAISSKLIGLMGSELKLKSQLDKGSEFYFTLPLDECSTSFVDAKREDIVDVSNNFNGKKILLVEDNEANQMYMAVLFKKLNMEYTIANDGVEAISVYKQSQENTYDLILMDENMPNMNGIETTRKILEYEQTNKLKHTPIVALTANALNGDKEKFLAAGMDEYLTKPISKERLIKVIQDMEDFEKIKD